MHRKTILSIFVCLAAIEMATAQSPSSGFFMMVTVTRHCEHTVFTPRRDKSYCVAPEPIIPIQQFQSVRSIGSGDRWAVDVRLTDEGLVKKKRIEDALPGSTLLLVVEGKAVAVFDANGKCLSSITYDDLKWAERHLANLIKN